MNDFLQQPGFLGTAASWGADFTISMMFLFAVLLTVGVVFAVKQKFDTHRWIQTTAVILNLLIILSFMLPPFTNFILPGIPEKLNDIIYWLTTLHAAVGVVAALLGTFIVLRANGLMIKALQFSNYKRFMRTSYALYMITVLLGFAVYYVYYV